MSLHIYFLDDEGNDIEVESNLNITHNLTRVVNECGKLWGRKHYELIWRPDELLGVDNGKVKVADIIHRLPTLLEDLINNEVELRQYLPSNGWGTFEGLIGFVCDYLKECYKHKEAYIYCCR